MVIAIMGVLLAQSGDALTGIWATDENQVIGVFGGGENLQIQFREGDRLVYGPTWQRMPDNGYVGEFWADKKIDKPKPEYLDGYVSINPEATPRPQCPVPHKPDGSEKKTSQYAGEGRFSSAYTNPQGVVNRAQLVMINARRKAFYGAKFSPALKIQDLRISGVYAEKDAELTLVDNPGQKTFIGGSFKMGGTGWLVSGERDGLWARIAFISATTKRVEGYAVVEWDPTERRIRQLVDQQSKITDRIRVNMFLESKQFPTGTQRYFLAKP